MAMKTREAREQFLIHLEAERGYSPLTISAYRCDIKQFAEFLRREGRSLSVEQIQTADIRSYVVSLQARGLQPPTIGRRINCLRSFFKFLWTNEYLACNPCLRVTTPKRARKLPAVLSEDECRVLLEAAYQCHYTTLGFRDRALLSILVYTGVHRQDLLDITLDDIDLKQARHHRRLAATHLRFIAVQERL